MARLTYPPRGDSIQEKSFRAYIQSLQDRIDTLANTAADEVISLADYGATGDGLTDETAEVQAAIDAAVAAASPLYWEAGTYVVTSNIDNFHSVLHLGPGKIKRGSDTFAVHPDTSDTNIIYVATTGVSTNDGLTSAAPVDVDSISGILKNYPLPLRGTWKIRYAAGTYTDFLTLTNITSENRLQVLGPSVSGATPTAIIDGTSATAGQSGMYFNVYMYVYVKDIKFQNFSVLGSTAENGVVASQFTDLWTENVHASTISWAGINCNEQSRIRVTGGILTACRMGVRVYANSVCSVGYQSSSDRVDISSCTEHGVYIRDGSTGHVDYTDIDSCVNGICVTNNVRVAIVDDTITNCTVGILHRSAGTHGIAPGAYLTLSGNTSDYVYGIGCSNLDWFEKPQERRDYYSLAEVTHTGDTSETTLKSDYSLPANTLKRDGTKLTVKMWGTQSGAGTRTLRVKLGATATAALVTTSGSTADWTAEVSIFADGSVSAQKYVGRLVESANNPYTAVGTTAVSLASATTINITVQNSDAAGSLTLEGYEVFIIE